MIIGRECRYLFIEIPQTASWAIHRELRMYYGGESILHKHAIYDEFRTFLGHDSAGYFVFDAVRNPLDSLVSRYVKLRSKNKEAYTNPNAQQRLRIDRPDPKKYKAIQAADEDFEWAFRRCWSLPYSDMIDMSANHLDFTIRFEKLQENSAEVLLRLGLSQVREVPVVNATKGKLPWESYYTPEPIPSAMRAC